MKKALQWNFLVCLTLLGACHKEATGQVAAVVNGDEITLQELNAELRGVPVREGADRKLLQQTALQRIIDRRLLAQQGRKDGLDKTPEFLIRKRQLEDTLLIQLMETAAARGTDVPSEKAIDDYVQANPALFADRTIYTLDRIQFAMPSDPAPLKALNDAHSMDAVAAKLKELRIQFARAPSRMDSAQVGQELMTRIKSLPPGEPFIVPENGQMTVAVITGENKQPVSPDQAKPIAVQAIRNKSVMDALQLRLKTAQTEAKIQYQPGFAPAKGKTAPSNGPGVKAPGH